jgi:hypothetical protein
VHLCYPAATTVPCLDTVKVPLKPGFVVGWHRAVAISDSTGRCNTSCGALSSEQDTLVLPRCAIMELAICVCQTAAKHIVGLASK